MRIQTYIKKNNDTFEKTPFNAVDALVFAWVAYFDFSKIEELPCSFNKVYTFAHYHKLEPYVDSFFPRFSRKFMSVLSESPRFKDTEIIDYKYVLDKKIDTQLAVVALRINGLIIIAIRGTDPSYTGWKEDFILSYKDHINSYSLADSFVKKIIAEHDEPIVLCGHSKGGNICTYLLSQLEDVSRIKVVYSFDGPGFRIKGLFKDKEDRLEKFYKIIPQSSFVGVLFSNETDVHIIKSYNVMMLQHNPFEWVVKNNDFIYLKKRTLSSRYLEKSVNSWIEGLDEKERERFTEIIFGELDKFEAKDFTAFFKKILLQVKPIYKAYRSLDKNDRKLVNKVMMKLAKNLLKPEKKLIA